MRDTTDHEALVTRYFELITELRSGVEDAAQQLTQMWDPDGVFEFTGSPEVKGTFIGINAIATLYRNRFKANGMPLTLAGTTPNDSAADKAKGQPAPSIRTALGVVDTDVHRVRLLDDDRAVAGWTTLVSTRDQRGFQISGSHSFTFNDGKITNLRVVISSKPETAEQFDATQLGIEDIGRLSLAAWMVV